MAKIVINKIDTAPNLPFALGRNVEHDERSRDFAFSIPPPEKLTDVIWPDVSGILDQGNVGSCTGNAAAQLVNTAAFDKMRTIVHKDTFLTEKDAVTIYSEATKLDNISGSYPPDDTGSSGLGAAKALKRFRYIETYTHCFTWDQFCAAIATQPVIAGTLWTHNMFTPDSKGVIHVHSIAEGNIAGGHEYMIRGILYSKSLVLMRNSWSYTWCPGSENGKVPGEAWISFADFKTLLKNQGDITVPHPITK